MDLWKVMLGSKELPTWKKVFCEVQVYQILRKAQRSAVSGFLGTIDLTKICFLHRPGEIRQMLVFGREGEWTASMELKPWLRQEIHRINKEIRALGIIYDNQRRNYTLWNEELGRALIIDFHCSTLKCRLASK
jgi:hypothetical protein